jgi:hypothetical protein
MKRFELLLLLSLGGALALSTQAQVTNALLLEPFETAADLQLFKSNNSSVKLSALGVTQGQSAGLVTFSNVDWPGIYFKAGTGFTNSDWRGCGGVAVDVLNTNTFSVPLDIRVDDDFSADGVNHCQTGYASLAAGQQTTLVMPLTNSIPSGMKGGPPIVFGGQNMGVSGATIDLSHIVAFQIFLPKPGRQVALFLDNIRLVPPPSLTNLADAYGQYTGGDWPGKIHQDADFQAQNTNELQWLTNHPKPPDRDAFGAWSNGPQLRASGFFRTAYVTNGVEADASAAQAGQGRWWLVSPAGRLFYSVGVDVINYGETTPVTGRETLFSWLPATGDPLLSFAPLGSSRTADFYGMNLYRKHGSNWSKLAKARALDRLDAWGFNTIGNWSSSTLFTNQRVPYTVAVGYTTSTLPAFYSANQAIVDVFAPAFPTNVALGISNAVSSRKTDPWCLGYFVENELPWAGWGSSTNDHYALPIGVLAATNPLPAKLEFVRELHGRYATVADLNAAWGTGLADWNVLASNAVTLPATPTGACAADLGAFLTNFARRYFSVVSTNLKQFAPNQLYLGCRFASHPAEAVNIAAEYCDVITFNIYSRSLSSNSWAFTGSLGKPCLIGEFHCGALDRGMFHPGLVQAASQADRGQMYQEYLRSVLDLPAFVGCHWFQYYDEPLTGRFDGENYNIGLVSGADTPYWEVVHALQPTLSNLYSVFGAKRLQASCQTNLLNLSWPYLSNGYALQTSPDLSGAGAWQTVTNPPSLSGLQNIVQLPAHAGAAFFRLSRAATP